MNRTNGFFPFLKDPKLGGFMKLSPMLKKSFFILALFPLFSLTVLHNPSLSARGDWGGGDRGGGDWNRSGDRGRSEGNWNRGGEGYHGGEDWNRGGEGYHGGEDWNRGGRNDANYYGGAGRGFERGYEQGEGNSSNQAPLYVLPDNGDAGQNLYYQDNNYQDNNGNDIF